LIETINLHHTYRNGNHVLRGVNFKAEKGEVTFLLGRNGAGKTTLLMHLNGLLKPIKGKVIIEGRPIRYDKKGLIDVRRKVGFVFQNPDDQIVAPTVWQEVAFGLKNLGIEDKKVKTIVEEALKWVNLEGFESRLCNLLSGGEKKRVTIASIIAMQPEIIILDEPTAGLDSFGVKSIVRMVDKMKREGKTVIISTHDMDFAYEVADKFVVIEDGKIIHSSDSIPEKVAEKCGLRFVRSY